MKQVRWTKEELKTLDLMTRKVLTMNGAFYSKRDVDRLYVSRAVSYTHLTLPTKRIV